MVFKGLPGVGKSTLSRRVARLLRAPRLDKDDVKDAVVRYQERRQRQRQRRKEQQAERLHAVGAPSGDDNEDGNDDDDDMCNDAALEALEKLLAAQVHACVPHVVVDAPFSRRDDFDRLVASATAAATAVAGGPVEHHDAGNDNGELDRGPSDRVAAGHHEFANAHARLTILIADCYLADDAEWDRRLRQRQRPEHACPSAQRDHRPASLSEVRGMMRRYNGSYRWTRGKEAAEAAATSECAAGCGRVRAFDASTSASSPPSWPPWCAVYIVSVNMAAMPPGAGHSDEGSRHEVANTDTEGAPKCACSVAAVDAARTATAAAAAQAWPVCRRSAQALSPSPLSRALHARARALVAQLSLLDDCR